jgi:phage minor structural protein, N-terminal region
MIPILYQTITEGIVPTDYGLGALSDCLLCEVTEDRNGQYELSLEYASNGIHADDIQVNRYIMAKPNFTDSPQLFRIYKVSKSMNGRFTVNAEHVSYLLSGKIATSGTANSCAAACTLLTNNFAGNFTITTDKTVVADFDISVPSSVRSWFGGKAGSFLDVFGTGEWHYDNFTCSFLLHRGIDRGVQIRYGKNLTELSQELDMSNLATGVIPYGINPDTEISISGTKISTGLVLDVDKDIAVDFTDDIVWDSATPVSSQLATLGAAYVSKYTTELTTITNNITLNFVQLSNLQERVDLCDTVHIYFEALGISASAKCVSTTWDVLKDRYKSCTFGDPKTSIADTISNQQTKLDETPTTAEVITIADKVSNLITGNRGGYVDIHDSDGDGKPDEILIMDQPTIQSATKVWRFNKNGLGYSNTGYTGTYGLAMTSNGEIVADFIKAGVISDALGRSEIDMTNGSAKMYELNAIKGFNLLTEGDEDVRSTFDALQFATRFILSPDDATNPYITLNCYKRLTETYAQMHLSHNGSTKTVLIEANDIGGSVKLKNENGNDAIQFFANSTYGGNFYLHNPNGSARFHAFVGGVNDDGIMDVFDGNGNVSINLVGHNGVIECGVIKPRDCEQVELWNQSFTSGELLVGWGYNVYYIIGKVSGGGSFVTMTIPRAVITTTDQRFQFTDEQYFFSFDARKDVDPDTGDDVLCITFVDRNASGSIQKIYGSYT